MNSQMRSFMSQTGHSFQMSKSFFNNSPTKTQSLLQDKSKISYYLKDNMTLTDASGLDIKGRGIQELDDVSEHHRDLETLLLDNNRIEDLQGIQQFQNIKHLSLINNQIGDILNVFHLRGLSQIENLDLRGNPIITRPAYRHTVLLFLKNLKMLDGKPVKASERLKIPAELSSQYSLLDRLLRNYVEILRLQSVKYLYTKNVIRKVAQRLDILKELLSLEKSYLLTYVHFDLDKLRRLYNYQDSINEKIRNGFRADLLSDIRLIELEFLHKQDMPAASSELLSRQSKSITELSARIKQKFQAISNFHRDNYPRFDAYEHAPEENVLPSSLYPKSPFRKTFRPSRRSMSPTKFQHQNPNASMTVNEIFNFQKNPFDSVNQSTLSLRSPVDNNLKKKSLLSSRPIHKSVVYERLYSPQRKISPNKSVLGIEYNPPKTKERALSPSQKDLLFTYQRNLMSHREGEQMKKGRPKSPQDLLNYVNATSQNGSPGRSRNYFNMSPKSATYRMTRSEEGFFPGAGHGQEGVELFEEAITKKDFKMKEEQLNLLNKNLKQKVEELEEVERSNKELKEKLKSLQKQNELEVNVAKESIEKVKREAQAVEQSRQKLETDIAKMKRSILELTEANSDLEKMKISLREEREDLKKYEGELVEAQIIEARALEAYVWYENNLKAKAFRFLNIATEYSKRISDLSWRRQIREERELLTQTFAMLKRNSIIAKILSYKESRIYRRNVQTFFCQWKTYTNHQKMERILIKKKRTDQIRMAFESLRQYTEMRLLKDTVKSRVESYYFENLVRKGFFSLKRNFGLYGLSNKVENRLNRSADAKNEDWIKRISFLKWHKWVKEIGIPKRIAINAANQHYQISLQRLGLNALRANFSLYKDLYKKAEMLSLRREMRITESVFLGWKCDYMNFKTKKRLNIKQAERFILKKKMNIWKSEHAFAKKLALISNTAQEIYETKTKKICFLVFLEILEKGKSIAKLEKAFTRKNNALMLKDFYEGWRNLYQYKVGLQKRERFEGLEALGLAFSTWILFIRQCQEKRRKRALAERQKNNILEKLLRSSMKAWKKFAAKGKRRKQVEKLIGEKIRRRIYRDVFSLLTEQRIQGIKENLGKLSEAREEVNKKMEECEGQIDVVNKKRAELIETFEEANDNMEARKEELNKKNKEIERYEEIRKDKEKRQNKLEQELKNKNQKLVELEAQNKEITKKVEKKSEEDGKAQEIMKEEREHLQTAIAQTVAETKEQEKTLKENEEEINSLKEKKENYLKESNQAIEDLTKELRLVTEGVGNKEHELKRAIELVKVLEKKNQELRTQLHGTVVDLEKNTLDYRSRAKILEQKNEELVIEINKLRLESERRSKEIIELRGTARRYEYEIQYMNGGEPRFISRSRNTYTTLQRSLERNSLEKDINNTSNNQEEGARLDSEIGDLKDYLMEKRKRLDQLDERQDEILRNQGSKDKIEEDDIVLEENDFIQKEIEVSQLKHLESFEESNSRGVKDSKRKIDEIRKKLEGVKRESRNLDDSIQKDSF